MCYSYLYSFRGYINIESRCRTVFARGLFDKLNQRCCGTDKEKIANMVRQLIPIIKKEKVGAVLIYGDTDSDALCIRARYSPCA